jgi:hypothetical protein
VWWEGVEEGPDALPCCFDGSLCGFAEDQLELGKDLFDRIEIGRPNPANRLNQNSLSLEIPNRFSAAVSDSRGS